MTPPGPLLACAPHAAQRLPLRPTRRADCPPSARAAQWRPAAAPRRSLGRITGPQGRRPAGAAAAGDLLVFNDTRVVPARLFGAKATGGRVEILLERLSAAIARARATALEQARACRHHSCACRMATPRPSLAATAASGSSNSATRRARGIRTARRNAVAALPRARPDAADRERYQTVYAREPGAVAAPTAGLHFDAAMLAALPRRAASNSLMSRCTSAPARFNRCAWTISRSIEMHAELRAGAAQHRRRRGGNTGARRPCRCGRHDRRAGAGIGAAERRLEATVHGETRLFITPGSRFRVVDALITNFHLPESTLLMLVCAFAGHEHVHARLSARRRSDATGFSVTAMRCSSSPRRRPSSARAKATHEVRSAPAAKARHGADACTCGTASSRRRSSCRSVPTVRSRR